jgi:hypothetical protein
MEAVAEERKAAEAEAAANAPPKLAPGRPRKLLGFGTAAQAAAQAPA